MILRIIVLKLTLYVLKKKFQVPGSKFLVSGFEDLNWKAVW